MLRHLDNQKGFTLLEVLVAMCLMAVGIFAVVGMQSVGLSANTHANQLSVASSLAQQAMEEIISWDISDSRINSASDGNFTYNPDPANPAATSINVNGAGTYSFTCSRTRGTSANGIPSGVVRIQVVVAYTYNNTAKNVTLFGFKRLV